MKNVRILLALAAATVALSASAYDNVYTHPVMSVFSAQKSSLYQDSSIMFRLGLLPVDKESFEYETNGAWNRSGTWFFTPAGIIAEGSFDEDSDITVRHHFFDPHFDRALSFPASATNHRSWEWALEQPDTDLFQSWSLRDAKEYLRTALTSTAGEPILSDKRRKEAMRDMFLSLGHVIHHLQDMAQPQHTRDDNHLEHVALNFTPFWWLQNPSRYERYSLDRIDRVVDLGAAASPLALTSDFRIPRDFWFNPGGTGIAQRTNREFVSHGTNFIEGSSAGTRGGYPLPLPGIGTEYTMQALFDLSSTPVPSEIATMCGTPAVGCRMTMVDTVTTPRASTFSIFDQDLKRNNITVRWEGITPTLTRALYSVNRFNFDTAHDVLLKRAVSYSAGFIDHFFRGKLMVIPPETGVYAVADHASGDGFRRIRVRVKNVTPNEALSQGTVRAIAKFHRNNCYRADLTGEFEVDEGTGELRPPCPYPGYRTEEAHIRVTAERPETFDVEETKEMVFDFQEPIPFDATDLILQVYYRGWVGIEEDGFALGAGDPSEPTYFSLLNATDNFEINTTGVGAFHYYQDIIAGICCPPFDVIDLNNDDRYDSRDLPVEGGNISYSMSLNGKPVGTVTVPEGRFTRFAALVPLAGTTLTVSTSGNGFGGTTTYNLGGKTMQYEPASNTFLVSPVNTLRGQSKHFNSVTYWHYFPFTGTPMRLMLPSRAATPTDPIAVQMAPQ